MQCRICQIKRDSHYVWGAGDLCWNCLFWQPFLHSQQGLRFRGLHYTIAGDFEPHRGGMPGTRWEFVLKDGRVILSSNVTCQGTIPERFMTQLPENVQAMRTTWREKDELPEALGQGNRRLFHVKPVQEKVPTVVEKRTQSSLFELL